MAIVIAALICLPAVTASAQGSSMQDLKRLSLEELMRVDLTTVMRVPEPGHAIPAAVFVITQDDIRRSGATSLPEVLRQAPGLQVARQDGGRYAVGIRGFADRLARSMLVLIDGRAVYSPLFAGTYWEVQDTLLADIDRIEIVRGPGGTLWGANAVNGIINIVTKRAQDSQGVLVSATLGTDARGPIGVRYGRRAGPHGYVRGYAKIYDRDAQFHDDGLDYDASNMARAGFRGDWTFTQSRDLTLQGDLYTGALGQRYSVPLNAAPFSQESIRDAGLSGGNLLARWSAQAGGGEYQLQTFYDRTRRDERPVEETRDTFDVDFQHRTRRARRHDIVWGAGYRLTSGRITAAAPTAFLPPTRTDSLYTAFVQDDFAIAPDRVRLVAGVKVEHNAYSGFELQPSARVMWTVNPSNAVFASVTRAVRTPSRVETDYTTTSLSNPAIPSFVRLQPNPDFAAEELTAYEAGYRVRALPSLLVSAAGFFNQLDNTLSTELLTPFAQTAPPPPRLIIPVTFANGLRGRSYGVELTGDFRPATWWRTTGNYSWLRVQMTRTAGSTDVSQERRYEGGSPQHQLQLVSAVDLPGGVSFNWFLRYVGELESPAVPGYATSNVRVAWQVRPQLEIALVGQDLHDERHLEWPTGAGGNVQIQRRAHLTVVWRR